jgi:signal transduction histidine kinase
MGESRRSLFGDGSRGVQRSPVPQRSARYRPDWQRRHTSSAQHLSIAIAGIALWAFACAIVLESNTEDQRGARLMLVTLIVGVPIAAGAYALEARRTARFGYILIAIGGFWSLSALAESPSSVPYSVGRVVAWLIFPLLAYVLLAFPDGRLHGRLERMLLGGVTLVIAALYIGSAPFAEAFPVLTPWASCRADCPANAFFVGAEPGVIEAVVQPVREMAGILLFFAVTAVLALRVRRATPLERRMLTPVLVMGAASSGLLAAFLVTRRAGASADTIETLGALWALSVPAVAAAFALGMVRHRLLLGRILERLSHGVSTLTGRPHLQEVLAEALDDPTVEVIFPAPAAGRWADADGNEATPPALTDSGRGVTRISDNGRPLAAILHDPALSRDDDLMDAVGAQVLSPLRHERLTGQLALSLAELGESRKRLVTIADLERSRIERNLHDGAQQRLVLLRIRLTLAEELVRADPDAGAATLAKLGEEIELALEELRALAHGVYPPVLSDRGLQDALRSVLTQAQLPVRLDARDLPRLPAAIETAVYFACVEALQNAFKHAPHATDVWVDIEAGEALRFEVGDDGPGFDTNATPGSGLRNMQDRLEAIGGRLEVDSAPGRGTRIRGVVPLD